MAAALIAAGALVGLAAYFVVLLTFRSAAARRESLQSWSAVFERVRGSLRFFLPMLGVSLIAGIAGDDALPPPVRHVILLLLVVTGAWLLIRLANGFEELIAARLGLDRPDNLDARRTHTQLKVLRSVLVSFIVIAAVIVVLLSFEGARQIGAGLLASAGLAGLVIGFAAQRALGNLLAGFQIAITQPIRIDDVVVVENEWGRIEEITLTYVVIKIWDERRLILPISYFLEEPFTNWTRETSEILGTVFLYVDYTVPIDAVRAELDRIVTASELWDGRVKGLQVTDSKASTIELRALVSARDASAAWNLRCEVREGLLAYLQREYPGALPRIRAELDTPIGEP